MVKDIFSFKDKIMRCFYPKQESKKQTLLNSFPPELRKDVEIVIERLNLKDKDISSITYSVVFNGILLTIPKRIYFKEQIFDNLTEKQTIILDCLFLRNNDGFLRQKHLKNLLTRTEEWIIPFCFSLLGEYVKGIFTDINVNINNNPEGYLKFIKENDEFYKLTNSRMISYWNCYHRRAHPNKDSYIGFQIFKEFEKNLNK